MTLDITSGETTTDMQMSFADPSGGVTADITGSSAPGTIHMEIALPANGSDLLNLAPAFAQGLSFSVDSAYGGSENVQNVVTDLGIVLSSQTTSSGPSTASVSLDADGLVAQAQVETIVMEMQDPNLPFPINIDAASLEVGYVIPLSARAEPQDFALLMGLQDLRIGTDLWDMIDPGKQLDRSPADMRIDMAGTTVLSADVTNFMQFGMMIDQGEMVATIEDFELREHELGALGAPATATAALTVDNTDWMSDPGFPKPVGGLSFSVNGLNAALDQLVSIGALSQDDIFGFRMMSGMDAQSTGDDGLSGTVQLGEDGSITANGQRLR
jgi:hypothetical protein